MESTTTASPPLVSVPSYSPVPNPNALDSTFGYAKKKVPSILVHYNAEPIDGSPEAQKVYIPPVSSTTVAPPVTTYKPTFYSTTTILPPTSTASYVSSTTTPASLFEPHSVSIPSKYFLPPFSDADNSPIIRIKPFNHPLPTPVAAYTIEQINNELQPPILPPIALNEVLHNDVIGPVAIPATISPHDPLNIVSSTVAPPFVYSTTASPLPLVDNSLDGTRSIVPIINRSAYRRRPVAYYPQNHLEYGDKKVYNARTPNGFGYYLPRHYHEETYRDANAQNRDGSFGYIDPFGIRRVVYYQASPDGGFKTRKNNRYVGFNAKPYDSKK